MEGEGGEILTLPFPIGAWGTPDDDAGAHNVLPLHWHLHLTVLQDSMLTRARWVVDGDISHLPFPAKQVRALTVHKQRLFCSPRDGGVSASVDATNREGWQAQHARGVWCIRLRMTVDERRAQGGEGQLGGGGSDGHLAARRP